MVVYVYFGLLVNVSSASARPIRVLLPLFQPRRDAEGGSDEGQGGAHKGAQAVGAVRVCGKGRGK